MQLKEMNHLLVAAIILSIVIFVPEAIKGNWAYFSYAIFFALIIIAVSVFSKKLIARAFDSELEHEVWTFSRYGLKPGQRSSKPVPTGIILPLLISAISIGKLKLMSLLTFETTALPSAKRKVSGYVFSEMTDWHIALFGSAGIIACCALSFLSYFLLPSQDLWRYAAFYAFWNVLPVSKLDGAQILYGSKVLWVSMIILATIFGVYGVILA